MPRPQALVVCAETDTQTPLDCAAAGAFGLSLATYISTQDGVRLIPDYGNQVSIILPPTSSDGRPDWLVTVFCCAALGAPALPSDELPTFV